MNTSLQRLYTDGATINGNPSVIGGAWAWCLVENDVAVREASGIVTLKDAGMDRVTNNYIELLAAVMGMETMPPGWHGTICTDSQVTAGRIYGRKPSFKNIPGYLIARTWAARKRLGRFRVQMVAGHPTKEELEIGHTWKGVMVSKFNVWCDTACQEEADCFLGENCIEKTVDNWKARR